MGIYLSNMDMPKDGEMLCVNIYPDGKVCINLDLECKQIATAISVPPHGRLIDADALWVEINKICDRRDACIITDLTCLQQILSALRHAPTIIPADHEGGGHDTEKEE